jgi:hypothetical protein
MRTCFSKKSLKKRCLKEKKSVHKKKKFEKNGKNISSKNKQKFSFKGETFFCFFKKKGSLNGPFLKTDTFGFAHK